MLGLLGLALRSAFREWLRRSDQGLRKIQADRWRDPIGSGGQASGSECPVGRYADCAYRRSSTGEEFPMAMTGTVKFFNGERGLRLHQAR